MTTNKPRILFVDDEPSILKALARLLHGRIDEWDLVFVDSSAAALKEAADQLFDVIVSDLAMPGMSGLELITTLNNISPYTRCIILTGTADLQTATEAINYVRVFRFYTKPCSTEVLVNGIAAALDDAAETIAQGAASGYNQGNIVLDRLSTGVMVVSRKGEVVYMNQSAAETTIAADGFSIGINNIIKASNSKETAKLQEACLQIDGAHSDGKMLALSIRRPSQREALKLIFAPLDEWSEASDRRIIIFVADPEKEALPSVEMIASFFGLTPAESNLSWQLIHGQRMEEIAATLGITISSARTYLKRIMEKTGSNRQVDLVRLLLSTPQITLPGKGE